ncbi:MAG TPA: hypothetical protein VMT54_22165 [Candidatus Cybelea sp.]|nr:hypothetical protein [Candidatus Cybelea sp.]
MKSLMIAVGVLVLGLALSACENGTGLYSSGTYYNSFGRDYSAEYQDGTTYHYHNSYLANAKAVQDSY